eukprot:scaffold13629_cov101-Isochrysis_galbana.AAC.7
MSISSYASDLSAASPSHSCDITQSTPSTQSGMVQPVVNEMFATVHAAGSSLLGLFTSCATFDSTLLLDPKSRWRRRSQRPGLPSLLYVQRRSVGDHDGVVCRQKSSVPAQWAGVRWCEATRGNPNTIIPCASLPDDGPPRSAGARQRDSREQAAAMLLCCYSCIAAIGPGRASSGRDEWGLKPNTMRSGSAPVRQLTRPRPPLAPPPPRAMRRHGLYLCALARAALAPSGGPVLRPPDG